MYSLVSIGPRPQCDLLTPWHGFFNRRCHQQFPKWNQPWTIRIFYWRSNILALDGIRTIPTNPLLLKRLSTIMIRNKERRNEPDHCNDRVPPPCSPLASASPIVCLPKPPPTHKISTLYQAPHDGTPTSRAACLTPDHTWHQRPC